MWGAQEKSEGAHQKNFGRRFAPAFCPPTCKLLPTPLVAVNEYQLRLGRQRQVWLIPLADETQGVQVKLCYPLTMSA